jgi:hypothetical protein
MARRPSLPEHIQAELKERAEFGRGHDMTVEVDPSGRTAYQARLSDPCPAMMDVIRSVYEWLDSHGAESVTMEIDPRAHRHPGCVLIRWHGDVAARDAAEAFACGHDADGTPLIPGWLSLRCDDDFDLRWTPTYAPITDPSVTTTQGTPDNDAASHRHAAMTTIPVEYADDYAAQEALFDVVTSAR